MVSPITRVTKKLLKGEKKLVKISVGIIVKDTNVNLPGIVILCTVLQLSHIIVGLLPHPKNDL